jgi:hypothetical protein
MDVRRIDDVVVVESQHGRPGELVEIVDQADQHGLRRKGPVALEQRQRLNVPDESVVNARLALPEPAPMGA